MRMLWFSIFQFVRTMYELIIHFHDRMVRIRWIFGDEIDQNHIRSRSFSLDLLVYLFICLFYLRPSIIFNINNYDIHKYLVWTVALHSIWFNAFLYLDCFFFFFTDWNSFLYSYKHTHTQIMWIMNIHSDSGKKCMAKCCTRCDIDSIRWGFHTHYARIRVLVQYHVDTCASVFVCML